MFKHTNPLPALPAFNTIEKSQKDLSILPRLNNTKKCTEVLFKLDKPGRAVVIDGTEITGYLYSANMNECVNALFDDIQLNL